jgi:hypothetical protein
VSLEYSEIAENQLDTLEKGSDVDLYNAIVDNINLIFDRPREAQRHSTAIRSDDGIVLRLPVPGYAPFKIFWTSEGPSIEAVFPHP